MRCVVIYLYNAASLAFHICHIAHCARRALMRFHFSIPYRALPVFQEACAARAGPPTFVACPRVGCGGTNFERFNFCQWCGEARRLLPAPADSLAINEAAIAQRVSSLWMNLGKKAHSRSKCAEFDGFLRFIASRGATRKARDGYLSALPQDVVDYLVYRDLSGAGRTKVHVPACMSRMEHGCDCPTRMAVDSLKGIASKIRTRFYELGCAGAWNLSQGGGNPADSGAVSQLLTAVQDEQALAGCGVLYARDRALLPQKFATFVRGLKARANSARSARNNIEYVKLLQDIAWFCVQYRSMNRGCELSALRAQHTAFGPNGCCALFQFTWTKTISKANEREHTFAVQARPNDETCPVAALRLYMFAARSYLGWNWQDNGCFIFPYANPNGKQMASAVTPGAMQARFKTHLDKMGMNEGEGLHGLRAGGAIDRALSGASLREIMLQGFWKSPASALRYIGMIGLLVQEDMTAAVRSRLSREQAEEAIRASQRAQPADFL